MDYFTGGDYQSLYNHTFLHALCVQEIVERFISQKETHQHLEKLREENEKVLGQLKEQKELLYQQFQEMKYSGKTKLSK